MTLPILLVAALCSSAAIVAAPPQDRPVETRPIRGRVVDPTGKPLEGVGILVSPTSSSRSLPLTQTVLAAPNQTDADGRFALQVAAQSRLTFAAKGRATLHMTPFGGISMLAFQASLIAPDGGLELGDVVLPPGTELRGRIVDEKGSPIRGAEVHARDLVGSWQANVFRTDGLRFGSAAETSADGQFVLPGVFGDGLELEARAAGHATQTLRPVDRTTPLTFTLRAAARLRGKVVDHDGKPVVATVNATFLGGSDAEYTTSSADGSFEVTRVASGPVRLLAYTKDSNARASTDWLTDGDETITMTLQPPQLEFAVRAEDAEGRPVRDFSATVQWVATDNPFVNLLRTVLPHHLAVDGVVRLAKPGEGQPNRGRVTVSARGFARQTTDAQWDPAKPELVVKLVAESAVAGKLVDADGKGLANTRMRVAAPVATPAGVPEGMLSAPQSPWTGMGPGEVLTAADGSFVVGGLGAGKYEVLAWPAEQPTPAKLELELAASERKSDITIQTPRGATLRGKLDGARPDVPAHVLIAIAEANPFAKLAGMSRANQRRVELDAENRIVVPGLAAGRYEVTLALMAHPRSLAPVLVSLGEVEVGKEYLDKALKPAAPLPTAVRGKVTIEGATVPLQRFMVTAEVHDPRLSRNMLSTAGEWRSPARTTLDADGKFALRVAAGKYRIMVHDLLTGLLVGESDDPFEVGAKDATQDLTIQLGKVRVSLRTPDDQPAHLSHLEVRIHDPRRARMGGMDFDTGTGLRLAAGQNTLEFEAPVGDLEIKARRGLSEHNSLGNVEATVTAGKTAEVSLDVKAGPPIK